MPKATLIVTSSENGQSGLLRTKDLQAILDERARAQMEGDEEGYLAALDPSNERLIKRGRMVFADFQQFPLDDVRFVGPADGVGWAPLVEQVDALRVAPVIKVVKLTANAGPDGVLGPGESFEYVVARRQDSWVVTDIVPLTTPELKRREHGDGEPGAPLLGPEVVPANAPWNRDRCK